MYFIEITLQLFGPKMQDDFIFTGIARDRIIAMDNRRGKIMLSAFKNVTWTNMHVYSVHVNYIIVLVHPFLKLGTKNVVSWA